MSAFMMHSNAERNTVPVPLRTFRGLLRFACFLGFAFFVLSNAHAQMPTTQNGTRGRQSPDTRQTPEMGIPQTVGPNGDFQLRRIRQLNVERQKEMVSETNELLKLTSQLNAEVAKNQSSTLTSDEVRMLARIEKLAKSIREKMSNPVQGSIFENNFPPPMATPTMP